MRSELRKDYIQEKYVIIAPRRKKRPHDAKKAISQRSISTVCGICPQKLQQDLIIQLFAWKKNNLQALGKKKRVTWDIAILNNLYPAITLDNPKAYGIQEVIVETPTHQREFAKLSIKQIAGILKIYGIRTKKISKNKKIQYILIFKNSGGLAGASLAHAHSQIFATDFLPPHLFDKSQRVQSYKLEHGSCVYCDVIKRESKTPRLIYEDKYIIAFTPYASMYNYEVWILPKRHLDSIAYLNQQERHSWARILKRICQKITDLGLPYNYYFHQTIFDEDQHVYMKITPRGSTWAGVEIGSGIVINPISPEDAAQYYRE